jgi:hypothetical protein
MPDKNIFDRYLLALRKTPSDDKTEHTDRPALQAFLQAVADDVADDLTVHHETKQKKVKGKSNGSGAAVEKKAAPDFKITKSGGLILGYVENKAIDENLNKVLKSEQIEKYKGLSNNIILTDYVDFIWINKFGPPQRERLCHPTDLENRRFKLREDRVNAVRKLLQGFFSTAPDGIGRSQPLALALARRSQLLRDFLAEELIRQEKEHRQGRLYGLFEIFQKQVFHELTLKEFADAFAQMLAYGLFLARLNSDAETITLHNARQQAVAINKTQSFKPMPEDVWNFHIGGYQVLDKYLKSRKGRKLTLDEIDHVAAVADSLAFTIEQMAKIDKAYRAAIDSGDN